MAGKSAAFIPAALYYHLPESAHQQVLDARDQIRLLAELSARSDEGNDSVSLSANALAGCFDRLADQLSEAMHECHSPLEV
jgi:hypothetical protein